MHNDKREKKELPTVESYQLSPKGGNWYKLKVDKMPCCLTGAEVDKNL